MRWKVQWKGIGITGSISRVDERRRKLRRLGTQIVVSKRRHAVHNARRQAGKRRIEHPVAGTNAALVRLSKQPLQEPAIESRRIREASSRSEVVEIRGR